MPAVANLAELLRQHRETGRPALIHGDQVLGWKELDANADAAAGGLCGLGLTAGDRVALHLPNVPDFALAYFGALRAGLVAVPIDAGYTGPELVHLLTDSGAVAVVTSPAGAPTVLEAVSGLPATRHVLVTGDEPVVGARSWRDLLAAAPPGPVPAAAGGEDLAVIMYTSGTSGLPKGAMLPHRALLANLRQGAQIRPSPFAGGDVVLLALPLSHGYGLNPGLGVLAYHGATGVLADPADPVAALALLAEHRVTVVVATPPAYVAWSALPEPAEDLREAFRSVRLALSGAAPLPADALFRLQDRTGRQVFFEGYGLTEAGPVLTSTLLSGTTKPESIGRPLPGVQLRLADSDGSPADPEDPGEIVVRGENLFTGYWPDGRGGPDHDGWWATGDVAFLDADGDLWLVDRRIELILVSGFNVYPREVERVLAAHPGVEAVAVVGMPHPVTGEAVKAVVVPAVGAELAAEDVIGYCARRLARFKCPTTVEFVTDLPHSAIGKVRKGHLRAGGGG